MVLPELPKLPNGKPETQPFAATSRANHAFRLLTRSNLKELAEMATNHVVEEGEVVMDSLGQMKKLSKWAIFENQAIPIKRFKTMKKTTQQHLQHHIFFHVRFLRSSIDVTRRNP